MVQNIVGETAGRMLFVVPKLPKTAQFEITNKCNLACKMCPREFLKVKFENMSFDDFKKMVDKLKGVKEIILTGWGEPLVHPDLLEMIRYCKEHGHEVRFTTNGLLLTQKLIDEIIDSDLDEIAFSVESIRPPKSDEWGHLNMSSLKNIQNLVKARGEDGHPKITLQAMLQKGAENDIRDIINWAAEHNIERVNLGRLDTRFDPNLKRMTVEEEKKLFGKADKLAAKLGVQLDCIQYGLFSGIPRRFYKSFKSLLHRRGKFCLKIYDYIYINVHGKVTPCCLLPLDVVGDLKKESLDDIWNGQKFKKRRHTPHPSCADCDVMKIRMIDDG